MRIIADTHIWYHMIERKYNESKIKSLPLYLTAWNIIELVTSPKRKMPDEKEKVINVAKLIKRLNLPYIDYEPYCYIANEILEFQVPIEYRLNLSILDELINDNLSEDKIMWHINYRNERVRGFKVSMDEQQKMKKGDANIENILSDPQKTVDAMAYDVLKEIKEVLGITLANGKIEISNQINFFLWIRASYCYKLQLENGYQAAKNDQGDLLNTVYVGQNDKYWIEEPKWVKNINDAGLGRFIFAGID